MTHQHPLMPGYTLNEYLVVIAPNEDLRNRITAVRRQFGEKFSAPVSTARPHLALARFVTWNMMEEKIINRFRHISMGVTPFRIELKDYGSYPSHSIYINVATRIPVQQLVAQLRTAQKMMKAHPDHDPHFFADPQITVASRLKPWQYEQGWLEFSHLHFTARIVADGMLLLKRSLGAKSYQIAERFEFMNLPVSLKQGELFV